MKRRYIWLNAPCVVSSPAGDLRRLASPDRHIRLAERTEAANIEESLAARSCSSFEYGGVYAGGTTNLRDIPRWGADELGDLDRDPTPTWAHNWFLYTHQPESVSQWATRKVGVALTQKTRFSLNSTPCFDSAEWNHSPLNATRHSISGKRGCSRIPMALITLGVHQPLLQRFAVAQCLHTDMIQLLYCIPLRTDGVCVKRYVGPETVLDHEI